MQYLKDEQHYIDLYDLLTIKECLGYRERAFSDDLPEFKGKKLSPRQSKSIKQGLTDFMLYFIKGDRYRNKASRIREWMNRDRQEQEKFDNTPEPNILCSSCGERMTSYSKILEDRSEQPLKVLFFLKCPSCQNRKGIYDTGEEFVSKPNPCLQCGNPLEISVTESKKGTVVTWVKQCSSCKFSETEIEDFEKKRTEWAKKEQENKKLLEKYRSESCLSEEEGQQYLSFLANMDQLKNMMDEQKEREKHKDLYDKVAKLKKLTIVELENLLTKTLAKEDYIKLELWNPEMGQFVIVNFTVRDSKEGRGEYDSENTLKKLINKALLNTNWRLMSDGITYRIGFLQGRLKAYEREEDLVKLVGSKKDEAIKATKESTVY